MRLIDKYPLQKRKILKKSFFSSIKALFSSCLIVVVVLFLLWISADRESDKVIALTTEYKLLILSLLSLLAIWILSSPLYEYLYYCYYYYDMDDRNVIIQKGIVAKREITLPFSKITDVYVDQDTADVLLGLYDIHISTPTAESGKFAHIDGLNKKGAVEIKKLILERVHDYSNLGKNNTNSQATSKNVTNSPIVNEDD